jgi:hypothetical protein
MRVLLKQDPASPAQPVHIGLSAVRIAGRQDDAG